MTVNFPAVSTNHFLSSLLSCSLPCPLRFQVYGVGKAVCSQYCGWDTFGYCAGFRFTRESTSLQEIISPRETLSFPMGILAHNDPGHTDEGYGVSVFSIGGNTRSNVPDMSFVGPSPSPSHVPSQIQTFTFAISCTNYCIGQVYKYCGIFFFNSSGLIIFLPLSTRLIKNFSTW